jgi:hypothetical protein
MQYIRTHLKVVRDSRTNQDTILYDAITADAFAHSYIVGRIGKEDPLLTEEEDEKPPPPRMDSKIKKFQPN